MMPITTLAMFVKDNQILLGMKKRGFGVGKWNGYGGKLLEGETPEQALIREIKEESTITVLPEDLKHLGTIDFFFNDKSEWNQRCVIYRIERWEGEPIETEEMNPKWFLYDEIPFADMWIDDPYWYPYFLRSEQFSGEIHFGEGGRKVDFAKIEKTHS